MDTDAPAPNTTGTLDALPERLRTHITKALLPGEQVVWVGQALARRVRYNAIWPTIGGLLLLAFWKSLPLAVINRIEQLRNATDSVFSPEQLGTLVFTAVLAGVCCFIAVHVLNLLMSLYTRPRQARYSACVVTNQRALIVTATGWRLVMSTRALTPGQLQNVFVKRVDARCGSIVLQREWFDSGEGGQYSNDIGFMYLADTDTAPAVQALRAIGIDPCVTFETEPAHA